MVYQEDTPAWRQWCKFLAGSASPPTSKVLMNPSSSSRSSPRAFAQAFCPPGGSPSISALPINTSVPLKKYSPLWGPTTSGTTDWASLTFAWGASSHHMQRRTLLPKESDPSQFTSSRRWTSPFSAAPHSNSPSVTSPGSPSSYSYSQGNTSEERQTLINTCYGSRTSNSSLENTRTTLPPPRIESSPNPTSLVCSSLRRKTYSRGGPPGTEKTATPRVIHWRQCVTNWHTFDATAPPATPPSPA